MSSQRAQDAASKLRISSFGYESSPRSREYESQVLKVLDGEPEFNGGCGREGIKYDPQWLGQRSQSGDPLSNSELKDMVELYAQMILFMHGRGDCGILIKQLSREMDDYQSALSRREKEIAQK